MFIYTTHIKKLIARLYFFILRSKTPKRNNNRSEIRRGQKFRLTPGCFGGN